LSSCVRTARTSFAGTERAAGAGLPSEARASFRLLRVIPNSRRQFVTLGALTPYFFAAFWMPFRIEWSATSRRKASS